MENSPKLLFAQLHLKYSILLTEPKIWILGIAKIKPDCHFQPIGDAGDD
jgi:hypothetical protein